MSAWILPDHIADVLPSEARHIEELRRGLIDTSRSYGYELVMPPMLEHLASLLTGAGEALDLQTFKLVDQLSGRSMGLRADMTQQVARIDAHLLNRSGVTRLCYCGSVLHARPDRPRATREPLQFGAEIYGHSGIEADLESVMLALDCLTMAGVQGIRVDLSDVRIVRTLLRSVSADNLTARRIYAALAAKDSSDLADVSAELPSNVRDILMSLLQLYGDEAVLDEAEEVLGQLSDMQPVLASLRTIASHLKKYEVSFDLVDLRGYSYYSGARFTIYAKGVNEAIVRGGRYDEVGAVYGRIRPAAGFSLDVKQLVEVIPSRALKAAIRAPWVSTKEANEAISALRNSGETVVCILPGHESEMDEFHCDRELVCDQGRWVLRPL
ncbi:ATP phosphoribosyltransferase regulatory subunit [Paracidovorax anthurii]|uniref:ATP phosphoribosyltransferase regulatory subunit n=1 Tax=Paracidovorax anthurii TaxID=78229 RepID=A0A328YDZ5_9BURK|nr:ATP phosphoribosyltransferase regulatory subunit [Paracidovorax anthurii]RAR71434.1 ATP phosphoribosyltransferase regulatory subunit [Paracidovorax anthurii]